MGRVRVLTAEMKVLSPIKLVAKKCPDSVNIPLYPESLKTG